MNQSNYNVVKVYGLICLWIFKYIALLCLKWFFLYSELLYCLLICPPNLNDWSLLVFQFYLILLQFIWNVWSIFQEYVNKNNVTIQDGSILLQNRTLLTLLFHFVHISWLCESKVHNFRSVFPLKKLTGQTNWPIHISIKLLMGI